MSPLDSVRARLRAACLKASRAENEVKLIAVSKTKSWEEVRNVLQEGQLEFGENYIQEALPKAAALGDWSRVVGSPAPTWHFIGHLQSNKAKLIPGNFVLFHGLDSFSLAEKLAKAAEAAGLVQDCLIEVNLDGEATKGGVQPEEVGPLLIRLSGLSALRIKGLMCIPAPLEGRDPREPFSRLRLLKDQLNAAGLYPHPLKELSMGMSGDFEAAVLEGSTMVRVGTAIFGARA